MVISLGVTWDDQESPVARAPFGSTENFSKRWSNARATRDPWLQGSDGIAVLATPAAALTEIHEGSSAWGTGAVALAWPARSAAGVAWRALMAIPSDDNPTRVPFERWKNGDDGAFAELHVRFTPLLRARIRRHRAWPLLDGHFELDDVLQEVWSRAIPAAKGAFRQVGAGSLLAFLGKIADRKVIDLARHHRARKRGGGGPASLATDFEVADGARAGRADPATPTSLARIAEFVSLARAVLADREFEAWDLVELQQFSPEEAGLAMRCTDSAIRGLLLRARAKLVTRMTADRPNGPPPVGD